ncbi:MAG: hypothetical protein ACOX05_01770 [Bacillota bacterium]|jgi:hypothetical protein
MTKESVLRELVSARLPLEGFEQQSEAALAEAEQLIKNYCGLAAVPEQLFHVWAQLAVDIVKADHPEDFPQMGEFLTAVSLGDSSYSFSAAGRQEFLGQLRYNYADSLNKFRKGMFGHEKSPAGD